MTKWTFKEFNYPTSTRAMVDGTRVYSINDEKLPSVTTILQATQSLQLFCKLHKVMKRNKF
jgi:hypothetical protein